MRRLKLGLFIGFATIFLTGCVSIPIGDGNKVKLSKEGIVLTSSDGSEHTISFDTESGSLYIDGFGLEDGFGLGETFEIPEDFPADIPIPKDAEIFKANDENGTMTLAYETEQSTDIIDELYTKYFNSSVMVDKPKISEEESKDGPVKTFQGIREDGTLDITFIQSQVVENGTTVAIVFKAGNSEPSKEFPSDTFEGGEPFKRLPGNLFNGTNILDLFPSDTFDDENPKEFPSDTFDGDNPKEFPSDTFDGDNPKGFPSDTFDGDNPEGFPSDTFNKKAQEFISNNIPVDFPMPENIIIYQANDLLGATLVAFETNVSPNVLGQTFEKYFQSNSFASKPKQSELKVDNTNVRVISGERKDGELSVRYSPSHNIKDGSKVVIIFK